MANPHQDLIDKALEQAGKANANHSGDKYITTATVYAIESNGRVEEAINRFNKSVKTQEEQTEKLTKSQVNLGKSQVFLGVAGIVVAIILAIAFS